MPDKNTDLGNDEYAVEYVCETESVFALTPPRHGARRKTLRNNPLTSRQRLSGTDRQLPAYRRDMFWNFKVGSHWLAIPKPFELGALGTGFERAVDYGAGNKQAFEGFFPSGIKPRELGSLLKAVSPVDEGVLFGPMKPFIEVITNRDIFRDRYIVPPHEQGIHPLGRKGTSRASRLGKWLSEFAVTGALIDDPRAWDHLTGGIFADFGRGAQVLSDFGREDKPSGVIKQLTAGLIRAPNAYGSLDVQAALNRSSELKQNRTKEVRGFLERLRKTSSAKTGKERDRRVKRTIKEAARLRRMLERKRPETVFNKRK